jgi:hypothetical protein
MPLAKGEQVNEQYHPTLVFSISDFTNGKKEIFNQLSEGIRNIILKSKELAGIENQDLGDGNNGSDLNIGDEEIPF